MLEVVRAYCLTHIQFKLQNKVIIPQISRTYFAKHISAGVLYDPKLLVQRRSFCLKCKIVLFSSAEGLLY